MIYKREKKPWHRVNVWQSAKEYNLPKTGQALEYAQKLFSKLTRKDGRREFIHAYRVAQILIYYGVREDEVIVAGIFHDLFENVTFDLWADIKRDFGEDVALMIWLLSCRPREDKRYYFARIGEDVATILVKLADRLHNLRNMTKNLGKVSFFTQARLLKQVEETWEYLVPMAVRAAVIGCQYREAIIEVHEELLRSLADAEWLMEQI
ncbi:MAG: HD domain-containing protein [Candidatus Moranbacteria bacterium]|jgi:GTP pyrophosphokinase|nr:HD domain-containing protein [Candidatus Moranbacteria bacterium]